MTWQIVRPCSEFISVMWIILYLIRCSLSLPSCRPPASPHWDSCSWSWVCHLSSSTGRPESPGAEADTSRPWVNGVTMNRMPTKALPFIKLPLICRALSQTGRFGCTKWRICGEPSLETKKNKRKKNKKTKRKHYEMWWGRKKAL